MEKLGLINTQKFIKLLKYLVACAISALVAYGFMYYHYENNKVVYDVKRDFDDKYKDCKYKYIGELCQYMADHGYAEYTPVEISGVDVYELEMACDSLIGAEFWKWRNKESTYSWEYDVLIARFAY